MKTRKSLYRVAYIHSAMTEKVYLQCVSFNNIEDPKHIGNTQYYRNYGNEVQYYDWCVPLVGTTVTFKNIPICFNIMERQVKLFYSERMPWNCKAGYAV